MIKTTLLLLDLQHQRSKECKVCPEGGARRNAKLLPKSQGFILCRAAILYRTQLVRLRSAMSDMACVISSLALAA